MTTREQRRLTRARALWTFAACAFTVGSAIAFGLGRPGLGVAFLVGLAICLGGLTRAGRSTRPQRR